MQFFRWVMVAVLISFGVFSAKAIAGEFSGQPQIALENSIKEGQVAINEGQVAVAKDLLLAAGQDKASECGGTFYSSNEERLADLGANGGPQELNALCCCNTYNGMCCNRASFCGGYVPGCICQ